MGSDRPHITYVIDDLGHGGAQRQLYYTLRALQDSVNLSVVVLSEATEPYGTRIRALGIPVETVKHRATFDAGRALSLARKLRRFRSDIAHATLEASDAYTFCIGRARRVPTVLSLRSDRFYSTGGKMRALGWMMRNADAVTVNSLAGRDYLVNRVGVRPDRVHLIPNIVEIPDSLPARDHVEPVIGAVGRLVAMKRFDTIIDALPFVRRTVPNARVVIIGDGPARQGLENLARREGEGAVEFLGAVEDASPHIARFACLVVASVYEGLPNAALEALAGGVPVVTVPAAICPASSRTGSPASWRVMPRPPRSPMPSPARCRRHRCSNQRGAKGRGACANNSPPIVRARACSRCMRASTPR
jgi:glycosyltransferase involved in cell wall biosynthesis